MSLTLGPRRFFHHSDGGGPGGFPEQRHGTEKTSLNIGLFFKDFAQKTGYSSAADIFEEKNRDKRATALHNYCVSASQNGYSPKEIAESITTWSYPSRIKSHQSTNMGQSPSLIVIGITSKLAVSEIFLAGVKVIEDGQLINGVSGRTTTNYPDALKKIADVNYFTELAPSHDMPPAAFIPILGRAAKTADLESESKQVILLRANLEDKLGNLMVGNHYYKIDDQTHDSTLKYRLLCIVWDSEQGKFFVVSGNIKRDNRKPEIAELKTPAPFSDWVARNMNDLISASDADIGKIDEFAMRTGLIQKLTAPGNGQKGFTPWSSLKEAVEQSGGVYAPLASEPVYRQASKVWRYALLKSMAANVIKYEGLWPALKKVEETLAVDMSVICDDSRQMGKLDMAGKLKILGPPTVHEFSEIFGRHNQHVNTLNMVFHYNCGFLTAIHDISQSVQGLKKAILSETNEFERNRKLEFFRVRFGQIADLEPWKGVTPQRITRDYMPFEDKTIYAIVSGSSEKYREIIKRGLDTGVLKVDETGFFSMPAAQVVHDMLNSEEGRQKYSHPTKSQIIAWTTDEVANEVGERLSAWNKKLPRGSRLNVRVIMETFDTGQLLEVPPRAGSAGELTLQRTDLILTEKFSPEDLKLLGLEDKVTYTIK